MKVRFLSIGLAAVLLMGWSVKSAEAQATMTQTTLSGALNGTSNTATVASANGISAGYGIYADRELMLVTGVSGTTLTVQRGYGGTSAMSHLTASVVFAGTLDRFYNTVLSGSCTSTQQVVLPRVNTPTGQVTNCVNGRWQGTNLNPFTNSVWPRTPIVNTAYTVLVSDVIVSYTSLTAARVVTLPAAAGMAGRVLIIKDEAGLASSFNISVSGTVDGATTAAVTTNYGVARYFSTGSAWAVW